jgi:hypothetical protein
MNINYQFKTNHYEIIYYYFVVLGLATSSYSQDKQTKQDREEGLMKVEELPAVVIKRIGADFSVYIPDNHPDKDVRIRGKFIAYDIGTDYEGTESYLLIMQTKNSSLSATYNGKGKLIRRGEL